MPNPFILNRSILPLLPDPVEALTPLRQHDKRIKVEFFGGLHNISVGDKLRWRDDVGAPLAILETESERGEFYPYSDETLKNGYTIQYISFLDRERMIINSHNKNHLPKHPIASVAYVSQMQRADTQQPVMVWHRNERLHTPDFSDATVDTLVFNVYAEKFARHYPKDHYIDRIVINNLKERWDDNQYVETKYRGFQIVLRSPRTPEDGDPTIEEWLRENCKHGFDLLADEPFSDENDEFHFLTDVVW